MFKFDSGQIAQIVIEDQARAIEVGKPIFIWQKEGEVEGGALLQLIDASHHPTLFHHVAAMPDVHQGYGLPIGGVVALKGAISPYSVGKDIGCGMGFVMFKFPWEEVTREQIIEIRRQIRKAVPMGGGIAHQEPQAWDGFKDFLDPKNQVTNELPGWWSPKGWRWIQRCLGTLGGGNHFIELQASSDGNLGIMIHSGSRKIGETVCDYHHKVALKNNQQWHSQLPSERLAFLPADSKQGRVYLNDMNFSLKFAKQNRLSMMESCVAAIRSVLGNIDIEWMYDIHHNYATLENHLGHNVWVHRKGATSAKKGETGIIPGSMGSASYIVEGKGNPMAFMSCPHGAGRAYGRKEACRQLDAEEESKKMEGVVHDSWDTTFVKVDGQNTVTDDLGEAPGAYKDISAVMRHADDLCEIKLELRPLGNLKGKDTKFNKRLLKKMEKD